MMRASQRERQASRPERRRDSREGRLVLDANVFVAAQWNPRSASAGILGACRRQEFLLCYSPDIGKEVRLVLRSTHAPQPFVSLVEETFRSAREFLPRRRPRVISEDPEDDKYLHCAEAAGARWIVTNDRHLLALREWKGAVILRPTSFQASQRKAEP
jgi:predicted nucleic acid-binding protein